MKALTYWGPRDVRYTEDHPAPVFQDARSVLVEVRLASICGPDLHLYLGSDADGPRGWCSGHEASSGRSGATSQGSVSATAS